MNNRATEDLLEQLHGLVAQSFIDEIRRSKSSGEGIPASLLGQATKFLKDNGIDAPARENKKVDLLASELEEVDFDDDDNVVSFVKN